MFRPVNNNVAEVEIIVDGKSLSVPVGISVAAAVLLQDQLPTRINPADASSRAPHCLMGACFECLVDIDGYEQRACQVVVYDGMRIARGLGDIDK